MKVLITGGAGYIGSTTCSALIDAGHTPVILDSLITGKEEFTRGRIFYQGDIADEALVTRIFAEHPDIGCTIHFAALVVVPESVDKPYEYYRDNVVKSLELFRILRDIGQKRIIFSSSASLYDNVPGFMVTEDAPLRPASPYARTKHVMEMVLSDICAAYEMNGIALRYFNPIGADPQMRTGQQLPMPSHVLGKMVAVACGEATEFLVTGDEWNTRDGSGIRDYLHVWDLALAHVKAVERFDDVFAAEQGRYSVINLGSGKGVTVFELLAAFERVYGKKINSRTAPARAGDVAGAYANADKAERLLGWKVQLDIEQGIRDALKWANQGRMKVLGY